MHFFLLFFYCSFSNCVICFFFYISLFSFHLSLFQLVILAVQLIFSLLLRQDFSLIISYYSDCSILLYYLLIWLIFIFSFLILVNSFSNFVMCLCHF